MTANPRAAPELTEGDLRSISSVINQLEDRLRADFDRRTIIKAFPDLEYARLAVRKARALTRYVDELEIPRALRAL